MENIITVDNVAKRYSGHTALDGVSLSISKGSIYGLLGPNGAGKTTLIRILTQITAPDTGRILYKGRPLQADDVFSIGYMPEERGLYKKMKVAEHIVYLARLKGMGRAEAEAEAELWMKRLDIADWNKKKVEELSKGMQQKVQFICTLIHKPELLILDEPFSGFDPVNVQIIKEQILEINRQGTTIVLSSHRMESVEEMCTSITLINKSRVLLSGSVTEAKQAFKKHTFEVLLEGGDLSTILSNLPQGIEVVEHSEGGEALDMVIKLAEGISSNQALGWFMQHGQIAAFSERLPSLNDIFIESVTEQKHA